MSYLEIYPIEKCVEKLSKQLDAVLDKKPAMYSKTKGRYNKIACNLLQSVKKISSILEEESLVSSSTLEEFDELSVDTSLQDVSDMIGEINNQIACSDSITFSNSQIHKTTNKDIIIKFSQVIQQGANHNFSIDEVNTCANLIATWFNVRFTPSVKNTHFRYKIDQLPKWIAYIIIVFGKYCHNCQVPMFLALFNDWIKDVKSNPNNSWAVPYVVYELTKSVSPESFTLDAVIIADILMDDVYYQLTNIQFPNSDVKVDPSMVYSLVKAHNPSLLPKIRTRFAKRQELIDELHFTRIQGGQDIE